MSLRHRLAASPIVIGLAFAGALQAQTSTLTMTVTTAERDSISPAPTITIHADPLPPELQPSRVRLRISKNSPFATPFVVQQANGNDASFVLSSLLPSAQVVYIRGELLDRNGNIAAQQLDTVSVRSWLRLESPPPRPTEVLFTRTPTFTWSSPGITAFPPGPWIYRYTILQLSAGNNDTAYSQETSQTSFTPPNPLDACTSYRFTVSARATTGAVGDTIVVSPGTFVIQSPECPQITISYQSFPNPFGRGAMSNSTCFWFDLAHRSAVKLAIYSLALHPVRTLVPGLLPAVLDSGAYGRGASDSGASGCDPRLSWDGTDDRGRPVPPGVYIEVFEADGRHETRKILFKGR